MTIEMNVVAEHGEVNKIGNVLPGEFGSFTDANDPEALFSRTQAVLNYRFKPAGAETWTSFSATLRDQAYACCLGLYKV